MSAPDLTAQRFWDGFDAARSEARAKAQTPLAAALEAFFSSEPFKAAIAGIIKASFEDGVQSERARIAGAWAVGERDAVNRPTESTFH
jgi:hypothetical protein